MLDFVISNYIIFIVIAVILLLGLLGYMMDKKKYEQYREEIINEGRAIDALEAEPDIDTIAQPVPLNDQNPMNNNANTVDPLTGEIQK